MKVKTPPARIISAVGLPLIIFTTANFHLSYRATQELTEKDLIYLDLKKQRIPIENKQNSTSTTNMLESTSKQQ